MRCILFVILRSGSRLNYSVDYDIDSSVAVNEWAARTNE